MQFKKMGIVCCGIIVFAATALYAQEAKVDDFNGGSDENYFENYWYYWDDNAGTHEADRPQTAPDSTPSVIDVPFGYKPRHAAGSLTDTFKVKDYQFLIKKDGANKYGCMPFTFGTKWKPTGYTAYPFVGIGAELAPDGEYIDLTGATAITFRLRSHVNPLQVNFRVEIMGVILDTSGAHYFSQLSVPPGTWTAFTVLIPGDLNQPIWAKDAQVKPFTPDKVAKISWEVHGEFNRDVKFDTLDVDDIVIKGLSFTPRSLWTKVESIRPASGLFSTFEIAPKNATPLGTYWYAYNDHANSGNSIITQGATIDPASSMLSLDLSSLNTGYGNAGFGAAIGMQFGKTVLQPDTTRVQGFAGIGFTTYDSAAGIYFNTTTGKLGNTGGDGGTRSIYFEYCANGDYRHLTLEVLDVNDVPDKNEPTRKDKRGAGIAWYRNVPLTNPNNWSRVCIPLDSLITHDKWKGYKHIPLDKTKIAKIQFKAQGAEGDRGTIQIDNVFFPGIDFKVPPIAVKNKIVQPGVRRPFRAVYRNGIVRVEGMPSTGFRNGNIAIIDSKGVMVKSGAIASAPSSSLCIAARQIPAGLYFVFLNGLTKTGASVLERVPILVF